HQQVALQREIPARKDHDAVRRRHEGCAAGPRRDIEARMIAGRLSAIDPLGTEAAGNAALGRPDEILPPTLAAGDLLSRGIDPRQFGLADAHERLARPARPPGDIDVLDLPGTG